MFIVYIGLKLSRMSPYMLSTKPSGRRAVTLTSLAQSFMQAVLWVSGLPSIFIRPSNSTYLVAAGILTLGRVSLLATKSAGTRSLRFST